MNNGNLKTSLARLYPVLGWTIGAAFVVSLIGVFDLNAAIIAALLIGAFAGFAAYHPFKLPGFLQPASVPGRITAVLSTVLMLSLALGFVQASSARASVAFAALKVSNYPEYMARLRVKNQDQWLVELRAHSPSEYLEELKRKDADKWFAELEALDPQQFDDVKKERVETLEARARISPASELETNLNTYKELAKLVPDDQRYQEKVSAYQAKWDATAWERANCTYDETTMAFTISKDFVKKALKAPKTAEFPWTEFQAVHNGGCVFEVRSYVDAQNGFGALIRTEWYTKLRKERDGWRLLDLKM